MLLLWTITLLLALTKDCVSGSKMVRQCTCEEYQKCKTAVLDALEPCSNQCQEHVVKTGADFEKLKECGNRQKSHIEDTINCLEKSFPYGCTDGVPDMIPRRNRAAMEVAILTETTKMMRSANLHKELYPFLGIGRKYAKCVQKCVDRLTNNCTRPIKCALDLPPAEEFISTAKQCAITNQFLAPSVLAELCECAVDAGLK
ncbi:unnamed protein product [Enterobius vermicularis]|uniref:CPG4 domain-containing protein n=1 Tax=Enterobius vermicularis TaxID=51028 RepID=A0A0N4VLR1_ENTVE|nr:unnamed protein product [Enterobius vermicularis]